MDYYEIVNEGTHYIVQLENGRAGTIDVIPYFVWSEATISNPKLKFQKMKKAGWKHYRGNHPIYIDYEDNQAQFNPRSKRNVFEDEDGNITTSPGTFRELTTSIVKQNYDYSTLSPTDPRRMIIEGMGHRSKRYKKNIRHPISRRRSLSKKNKKKKIRKQY